MSFEAWVVATPDVASDADTFRVMAVVVVQEVPFATLIEPDGLTVSRTIVSDTVDALPAASVTRYQTVFVPFVEVSVQAGLVPDTDV